MKSNQHKWISNMLKFSETTNSNSFENIACTGCSTTTMASIMDILLKVVLDNRISYQLKVFHKNHRRDANMFGSSAWDEGIQHHIRVELVLFLKFRAHFFSIVSDRYGANR